MHFLMAYWTLTPSVISAVCVLHNVLYTNLTKGKIKMFYFYLLSSSELYLKGIS